MTTEQQDVAEYDGKTIPTATQNKIVELRNLETALGHLPPSEFAVKDLHNRVNDPGFTFQANQMEQKTELLFSDICDDLTSMGFSAEQTATIVNSYLRYPGGPKYCNAEEVQTALES
jgi:hypothetical protein